MLSKRAASQLLGAGLLLCLGSHFLPFFDAGGLLVRCIGDLIQLKTEGFLFCFIYCCFIFLPDWVLTVAICRSADAGVKRECQERWKSQMMFLLQVATHVSLKSGSETVLWACVCRAAGAEWNWLCYSCACPCPAQWLSPFTFVGHWH